MGWFFRALRYWQCFSAHFFLQLRESHGLLSSLPLTMLPAIWSLDQDRDRAARFITCREGEIVREDSEEREREGGEREIVGKLELRKNESESSVWIDRQMASLLLYSRDVMLRDPNLFFLLLSVYPFGLVLKTDAWNFSNLQLISLVCIYIYIYIYIYTH